MKRWIAGTWMAIWTVFVLSGCGGGGTAGGGQQVLTDYAFVIRVVDLSSKARLSDAEVYFITATGDRLPWQKVVAGSPTSPNEISLTLARTVQSDIREGDFLLRNVPGTLTVRGIWIRRPAGFTAVARHTTPDNIKRTIQLPDEPNIAPGCLIASNKAGEIRQVFGAPQVVDFGIVEIAPDRPDIPPPPVDEPCP